ncbi:MAG: hypothetical protein CRN43_17315 [Candidatus Nephrothrix sp. EaCA]|nr:MAG: hypothetical protein CRN43_17315 [Candidatus Nephrothrix sp. EaCA]
MSTQKIADQYKKALRRMNNAKEILSAKAGKEGKYYHYEDVKYVKKACRVAYKAVLIAINAYLEMKEKTINGKPDLVNLNDYRRALSDDTEIFNDYNNAWNTLYFAGYNGVLNSYTIASGIESGDAIINAIRPAD